MAKKILVVNPDPMQMGRLIELNLTREDYEVTLVEDVDQAWELIKKAETRPDLVIADEAIPGKNGLELTRMINEDDSTRDIPIIIMSLKEPAVAAFLDWAENASAVLHYPLDPRKLLESVGRILADQKQL